MLWLALLVWPNIYQEGVTQFCIALSASIRFFIMKKQETHSLPRTVEKAVDEILVTLSLEEKTRIANMTERELAPMKLALKVYVQSKLDEFGINEEPDAIGAITHNMREVFTFGSVGRAPGNRCLYPEAGLSFLCEFLGLPLVCPLSSF